MQELEEMGWGDRVRGRERVYSYHAVKLRSQLASPKAFQKPDERPFLKIGDEC